MPSLGNTSIPDADRCPALGRYIAAGCLVVERGDSGLPDDVWARIEGGQWYDLEPGCRPWHLPEPSPSQALDAIGEPPPAEPLSRVLNHRFFGVPGSLSFAGGLLRCGWVRLSVALASDRPDRLVVRVYILPDDVDNAIVPRSDANLKKARAALLARLDFSPDVWAGLTTRDRRDAPRLLDDSEDSARARGARPSLLEMFNSIPSPAPITSDIDDYDAQEAADNLLNSRVAGLDTALYLHQRRSAALMVHWESQKRLMLDPRLSKVADPRGQPWYYDAIAGTCLREPRFYDGPCGGILAEDMGSGKTLICLSLILATRHIPASAPDHLRDGSGVVVRPRVGSLADMAAAYITRNSVPWRNVFGDLAPYGVEYPRCVAAIRRNPASYTIPIPPRPRSTRRLGPSPTPRTVYLSHASLVVVPSNLVQQWKHEIAKHTSGLAVLSIDKDLTVPPLERLLEHDVVLFSFSAFEKLAGSGRPHRLRPREAGPLWDSPLDKIRFKRCIVDEGHKLGSSMSGLARLPQVLSCIHAAAKWIVTGTPSKGLFGVEIDSEARDGSAAQQTAASPHAIELDDLKRVGSLVSSSYLRIRPWDCTGSGPRDSGASWHSYVERPWTTAPRPRPDGGADAPKEPSGAVERRLWTTLRSVIIRHRLSDVSNLLPVVDRRVVYLDGSFQDRLALNLFSMMIIFNAVQSQRTDQDYFFHPRQRSALSQLVSNLRQASFFGGAFFSPNEIRKAVKTAEEFLEEGKIPISTEDEALLRDAIALGRLAETNALKRCVNVFHEIPLYVEDFPWHAGREWSLDFAEGDPVCTDSRLISALQKLLRPLVDAPTSLQLLFQSGRFQACGLEERAKGIRDNKAAVAAATARLAESQSKTLAGNTGFGEDSNSAKHRSSVLSGKQEDTRPSAESLGRLPETDIAAPLAQAKLVSTASAKLSYLIDQIMQHQEEEQIIVFYDNDNVAYYLAGVLEILQVEHLIYAKGLSLERRNQYVVTFNTNPKFRVLLMDITLAAFGIDIQSASRIYFIHPVLNPQVEAQAIGRARRISSNTKDSRPVTVETLVLRGSVDEVVVRRRREITQAEARKCRGLLDDKPINNWIRNVRNLPLPGLKLLSASAEDAVGTEQPPPTGSGGGGPPSAPASAGRTADDVPPSPAQTAPLARPQFLFGRGFGRRPVHPDEDLAVVDHRSLPAEKKPNAKESGARGAAVAEITDRSRRKRSPGDPELVPASASATPASASASFGVGSGAGLWLGSWSGQATATPSSSSSRIPSPPDATGAPPPVPLGSGAGTEIEAGPARKKPRVRFAELGGGEDASGP
ncbi:hypothetical protein VTJ83DRAFT_5991 [Remersonia thermophila]|uniref:Helicase C-terminal domain-containing protein n=1 Tax=Remersonia thermophila TaxID=72144 RepID=A0ABR4DAL1_9PEZI